MRPLNEVQLYGGIGVKGLGQRIGKWWKCNRSLIRLRYSAKQG